MALALLIRISLILWIYRVFLFWENEMATIGSNILMGLKELLPAVGSKFLTVDVSDGFNFGIDLGVCSIGVGLHNQSIEIGCNTGNLGNGTPDLFACGIGISRWGMGVGFEILGNDFEVGVGFNDLNSITLAADLFDYGCSCTFGIDEEGIIFDVDIGKGSLNYAWDGEYPVLIGHNPDIAP